ncbi:hypothetical protein BDK51DRAFT_39679 [Blyttiomyces helicus]|uniref:Uncharacterized protein n=1 Tax=Blyttiomyces helicus TaxID=388810 RepID=A0A4P9VVL0_9FUNG|nr:hypothetical protein BDK51DRAFT_39679 [Blyttiomyces helicus]|eukprot:RKO83691.1 hypothetical protein BDK51DRAFT_39679 [Blyttiomyces helicus]
MSFVLLGRARALKPAAFFPSNPIRKHQQLLRSYPICALPKLVALTMDKTVLKAPRVSPGSWVMGDGELGIFFFSLRRLIWTVPSIGFDYVPLSGADVEVAAIFLIRDPDRVARSYFEIATEVGGEMSSFPGEYGLDGNEFDSITVKLAEILVPDTHLAAEYYRWLQPDLHQYEGRRIRSAVDKIRLSELGVSLQKKWKIPLFLLGILVTLKTFSAPAATATTAATAFPLPNVTSTTSPAGLPPGPTPEETTFWQVASEDRAGGYSDLDKQNFIDIKKLSMDHHWTYYALTCKILASPFFKGLDALDEETRRAEILRFYSAVKGQLAWPFGQPYPPSTELWLTTSAHEPHYYFRDTSSGTGGGPSIWAETWASTFTWLWV